MHELIAFVNHTIWDGYIKVVGGKTQALKFPQKINALAKNYYDVQFKGNSIEICFIMPPKYVIRMN